MKDRALGQSDKSKRIAPDDMEARRRAALWPFWISISLAVGLGLALTALFAGALFKAMGSPQIEGGGKLTAAALVDSLRLAFFATAGVGGVVGLLVAYRKQRIAEAAHSLAVEHEQFDRKMREAAHGLQETLAADSARDAIERRITDLFSSSVEQLGSDRTAMRLGAVFTLERLAQGHPEVRQNVVNVVCAYLRLPFKLPRLLPHQVETRSAAEISAAWDEVHVRLEIQDMLHRHLVPEGSEIEIKRDLKLGSLSLLRSVDREYGHGLLSSDYSRNGQYWAGMHLDLARAVLIDLNFRGIRVASVNFANAHFHGRTDLCQAEVEREATFVGCRFRGPALFIGTKFKREAFFRQVRFRGFASFEKVSIEGHADFVDSSFYGLAHFNDVNLREAEFDGATFRNRAVFRGATFHDVDFGTAAFWLDTIKRRGTQFRSEVDFSSATFVGRVAFHKNRFYSRPVFDGARFSGEGWRGWPDGFVDGPEGTVVEVKRKL